ncbi:AMP-activated serine/threonine-protein kinase regulatory subunit [Balamuthia mandrillaris]
MQASGSGGGIQELLASTKVVDLLPAGFSLKHIDSQDSVELGLRLLVQNNIYSAPVLDAEKSEFLGLIDLNDVVLHLVRVFLKQATGSEELSPEAIQKLATHRFKAADLSHMLTHFMTHPIKDLINLSGTNALRTTSNEASVQSVLDTMVKEQLSRIVVVEGDSNRVVGLVSQSNIVNFLAKHESALGPIASKTLGEAKIGSSHVIAVPTDTSTIVAFAKICLHNISHLAITNEHGHLVGNISLKDVKGAGDFAGLVGHVYDYVNAIRRENLKAVHPAIHANDTETVGRTIVRLATIHIHRIYLTHIEKGQQDKVSSYAPSGVVSLRDVLSLFVSS